MERWSVGRAGWGSVVGLTAFIYVSLPVMPSLWRAIDRRAPLALVAGFWLLALVAVATAWVAVWVKRGERRPIPLGVLAATTGLFAWGISIPRFPAERFHFLEYGLLGILVLRASVRTRPGRWAATFGLAALVVCSIGVADELIQLALPNRVFDLRDIWFNVFGGVLGFGAYLVAAPPAAQS